jgi:hypothetical protein
MAFGACLFILLSACFGPSQRTFEQDVEKLAQAGMLVSRAPCCDDNRRLLHFVRSCTKNWTEAGTLYDDGKTICRRLQGGQL